MKVFNGVFPAPGLLRTKWLKRKHKPPSDDMAEITKKSAIVGNSSNWES